VRALQERLLDQYSQPPRKHCQEYQILHQTTYQVGFPLGELGLAKEEMSQGSQRRKVNQSFAWWLLSHK
jgi:hypothetical protein